MSGMNKLKGRLVVLVVGGIAFSLSLLYYTSAPPNFRLSENFFCTAPGSSRLSVSELGNTTTGIKPTTSFRDSLHKDKKYITTFSTTGWSNDMMNYFNIIYLGLLSSRIPVMAPFFDTPIQHSSSLTYMGDIFDLPRLSSEINLPITEWRDIKDISDLKEGERDHENPEAFGCWSAWWGGTPTDEKLHFMQKIRVPRLLGLDISWTKVPQDVFFSPGDISFRVHDMMALAYPERAAKGLEGNHPEASPRLGKVLEPDHQLFCLDTAFYMGASASRDLYDSPHGLVWRFVGQHAHFLPHLEEQARVYIRDAMGLSKRAKIPPFIAIHVRRRDFFTLFCQSEEGCLPTASDFLTEIRKVQSELQSTRGVDPRYVVVTSDDMPGIWREVEALNLHVPSAHPQWVKLDYEGMKIEEQWGGWFVPVFDSIVHSMSQGFVGTELSTFSELGRLRVRDWNNGVVRSVGLRMK